MGYTTDFRGSFTIEGNITQEQIDYINKLATTRRMKRNSDTLMELYKGEGGKPGADKTKASEVYGVDGEFFVNGAGSYGQGIDISVIDSNTPPSTQPGLWCQWEIYEGELQWDGNEKFYDYIEWLHYLINNFFKPWGLELTGTVEWRGEDWDDTGEIVVSANEVKVL